MKKIIILSFVLFFLIMHYSCEKKTELLSPEQQVTSLQFDLSGLENPGASAKYSLWAAYDSSTVALTKYIGDFSINNQGKPDPNTFDVNLGVMQKASTLVVSIEHADSLPDEASTSKILAAKLVANSATFSVGDEYLLDFSPPAINGFYQVVKAVGSDSVKGIWFMTGDTTREAGLELPEAIPGWRYEGYVIVNGTSYPTGFFYNPGAGDRENIYGHTLPTFPFPGQNFEIDTTLISPGVIDTTKLNIDLRGAAVLVKIVPPKPAFSNIPYELTMFSGTIPLDATENTTYQLNNMSENFPKGSAELIIKLFE